MAICFVLIKLLPYEPNVTIGQDASIIRETMKSRGYFDPIPVQFWNYLTRIFQGDFGIGVNLAEYRNMPVWDVFIKKLPPTVLINVYSSIVGIILSLISIILILIILILQAKNIFNYKYFTLFLNESYNNDYYINLNELNIMIGIVDNKGNFIEIDEKHLTVSANINNFSIQSNNELNLNATFIALITCNLTNI
jgi:ABC-type microcin C transport system permease subunit YejB